MNRPWQIWLTFVGCLAVALLAVGWLTVKALQLDQAEAVAREQALLEENARLALWRMDSTASVLVGQETARPYFVYRSFHATNPTPRRGKGSTKSDPPVPSSLLVDKPPHVVLHFQIDANGDITSPQVPSEVQLAHALQLDLQRSEIDAARQKLGEIAALVAREDLAARLPALPEPTPVAPLLANDLPDDPFGEEPLQQRRQAALQQAESRQSAAIDQSAEINQSPEFNQQAEFSQQAAVQQSGGKQSQRFIQQQVRGASEFQARSQYLVQNNVNSTLNTLNNGAFNFLLPTEVQASVMTPLWLNGQLLLARTVTTNEGKYVQGCLLDWPGIKQELLSNVRDLLPSADLTPVDTTSEEQPARMLASLPLQLVPGMIPDLLPSELSPIQLALVAAWLSLLLAAVAVAALMQGVVSLSERRAAFVSAVTHELRTPLTTFRMYAEMLAENMVPDEPSRQRYLHTLQHEADRLTHLVENVLAYARLERGRPGGRVRPINVGQLVEQATERLGDRAAQGGLEMTVDVADKARTATALADASAVEQILFNLVDNACKYAASGEECLLHLEIGQADHHVYFKVRDRGPGIGQRQRRMLFRPFHKSAEDAAQSAPGVGLGLALSRRLAREMGGDLQLAEQNGKGACFLLSLPCLDNAAGVKS